MEIKYDIVSTSVRFLHDTEVIEFVFSVVDGYHLSNDR